MDDDVVATRFSRHAFDRVEERLTAPKAEVAALLDDDRAVPIGDEHGSHRAHRLFHSLDDGASFVAVQDPRSGTVVTVLPIDYHERCAWAVAPTARLEARSLAQGCDARIDQLFQTHLRMDLTRGDWVSTWEDTRLPPAVSSPVPASTETRARGTLFRLAGWRVEFEIVDLGAWIVAESDGDAHALLSDDVFLVTLRRRMTEANADAALGISVRRRGSGSPVVLRGLAAAFAWAESTFADKAAG